VVDCTDWEKSIISFLRKGKARRLPPGRLQFYSRIRYNYRVGVPAGGYWKEVLNSDAGAYGGSGHGNLGGVNATSVPYHGRYYSLSLMVPPLGILFFKSEGISLNIAIQYQDCKSLSLKEHNDHQFHGVKSFVTSLHLTVQIFRQTSLPLTVMERPQFRSGLQLSRNRLRSLRIVSSLPGRAHGLQDSLLYPHRLRACLF